MITNYGELKTAVLDWANRRTSWQGAARVPDFISRATAKINRRIHALDGEIRAYTETIAGQAYYPIPSDMIEIRKITVQSNPRVNLIHMTPSRMDQVYPVDTSQIPLNYSTVASQFRLAPLPSGVFNLEIVYSREVAQLVADTDTNWVLQKHPFIYLHGALAELFRYSKDYPALADSDREFNVIDDEIETVDIQKTFSGIRTGSPYHDQVA